MIPTALKEKLSKLHCYPVGAQVVSNALEGLPQIDDMRLWFSSYPKSSLVMSAKYTFPATGPMPRWMGNSRYGSPRWDINVYAVPRDISFSVKTQLKQHGLLLLRDWLGKERTETWLEATHRIELHYDPALDSITTA